MASDDMHVIMYKILCYLYKCMKDGVEPDLSMVRFDGPMLGGIPELYWRRIMQQLVDGGYVGGVSVSYFDNAPQVLMRSPYVTLDGVEFLQENSMMAKAKKFLMDAKAMTPGL